MKSHKHVIMKRARVHGVYANVFVKHVELRDSKLGVEYTNDPSEAMIVYGRNAAVSYTMLLGSLTYGSRLSFITDKIGRFCRPNAYLIYSYETDERIVYRFRDRAESTMQHLKPFKPVMYPLYGYVGHYDY